MDEQLRQLEEESRSLNRTLDERIDNLEARMGDNNMIRRQQAEIHAWLDYEFDELMVSMEAERRRISGQDALYTIWEEEEEINPGSWETWSDLEYEPRPDPVMYESGDLICNHLTIQQGFDHYSEFPHLFPTEKPTELPPLREPMEIMQHKIELIEGAEWHPNYATSYDRFQDQITEKINKELETGRVIPSKSLNTIIMFTQPKKDGKKARFLLNCLPRNLKTHKARIAMPNINQIIDWLASKKFKSKLDLTDGYHNIRHHPDSVKHSTFSCHMGKFDSLVMQQGDCNAPATMMRAINWLLREFLGKTVMVYLDDILIGNNTYEEHVQTVRTVLKTLEKAKMWFNKNKCQIMPQRMELLVHVLHNKGLKADPEKIKKVVDFKTHTNGKEIQRFMGVVNYLARFCKDLATKGRCLYELQGSTKQFKWTHLHNEAFKQVKELIMSNAVLKPINHDSNEQIYLITDASNTGLSGWIGQKENGVIRPAAFHSRCQNKGQTNYTTTDKEL